MATAYLPGATRATAIRTKPCETLDMLQCRRIVLAAVLAAGIADTSLLAADRDVAWVVVGGDDSTERELNTHAARGLRLAAVTDGLPCSVAIMQRPETPSPQEVRYRVVADRDLAAALPELTTQGFEPRGMLRRQGGRALVVWERAPRPASARMAAWRLIEFGNPDTLEADLTAAAADGFRAVVLARGAFRSWPGLSEKGLLLVGKRADEGARSVRVLRGSKKNVEDLDRELAALTADGWEYDLLFTSSRDGSQQMRRERAYLVLSRGSTPRAARPLRLVRSSSWGSVGDGEPVAAANYWHEFLFVSRPDDRRRAWGSPIRLSDLEASGVGLGLRLGLDGGRDQRSTIASAVARQTEGLGGYELVIVVDERFGR